MINKSYERLKFIMYTLWNLGRKQYFRAYAVRDIQVGTSCVFTGGGSSRSIPTIAAYNMQSFGVLT